jgi:hypothetical protein
MKKLFLTLGIFIFSLNVYSQKLLDLKDLVGYWEPDATSTQLVMWFDKEDYFQIVEFSTIDGAKLTLLSNVIVGDCLKIKTLFEETNYISECEFRLIDKNTLECKIKGSKRMPITYTKIK